MTLLNSDPVVDPVTPPVGDPVVEPVVAPVPIPTLVTDPAAPALADWKAGLPDDLKEDPALGPITDINALAKSYVNAQKMVGADKIQVPSKFAEKHEWNEVFQKLGLPKELTEYEIKPANGQDVDPAFLNDFKQAAFGEGILPGQAEAIFNWYQGRSGDVEADMVSKAEAQVASEIKNLKEEWGEKFPIKLAASKMVLKQFDKEGKFTEYLGESGLGNDSQLVKFLAHVGESMNEDTFRHDVVSNLGMDAKQAQAKINSIRGDGKHAYHTKDHPEHSRAVDEMARLFEIITGA